MILLDRAADDLEAIRLFSEERWGQAQAVRYLRMIKAKIETIAEFPGLGTRWPARHRDMRSIKAGQHRVFFTADADEICIVRVLHVRMDHNRLLH